MFVGVRIGVDQDSVWVGVITGVLVAVLFGTVMTVALRRPLMVLDGLSGPDREAVIRSIRKGQPVADPRLAPAVVRYAATIREMNKKTWASPRAGRLLFGCLAILGASLAVVAASEGNVVGLVWNGLLTAGWTGDLLMGPKAHERRLERIEHAERSARTLLDNTARDQRRS